MHMTADDIAALEKQYRAALVNSLTGFKSANLVGTASADGESNLAIMSSAVHLGSAPALLALIVRPGGEERHTLANILATGAFSINHVNENIIESAHQTAARYPSDICEFAATGLTPQWHQGFAAPLVKEAGVRIALALREHQELKINGTHLVIGEIVFLDLQSDWLGPQGHLDLAAAGSVALSGLDTYYRAAPLKRMAYAKPDLEPRVVAHARELANPDATSTRPDASASVTQTGDAGASTADNTLQPVAKQR